MRAAKDKVTAHLAALEFYQLAVPAPALPERSFDKAAAARGAALSVGIGGLERSLRPLAFSDIAHHGAPYGGSISVRVL